jgi:hypothetical protein
MDTLKRLIAASVAVLTMTATLAADDKTKGADTTTAAVDALKANLGSSANLEVQEVRVTESGVACIEYRVSGSRGHAVVQNNEVLKSSSDAARFEKAWNEHCLGPRGGMTPIG